MRLNPTRPWLTFVVLLHLAVCLVHGFAHQGAGVALAPAEIAFVGIVIITAPLAGLALMWRRPVTGAAVVAAALGASLLFGLVEHFMLGGADHVSHVAAPWRPLFGTTAILVAVLEAAGTVAAVVSLAQSQVRRVA